MSRASSIVDRIIETELRVLVRLYDVGSEPFDLSFYDVAHFPLDDVDRSEVRVRLLKLKRTGWISGEEDGDVFRGALLEHHARKRLNEMVPGTNVTWIRRAKEMLVAIDAGTPSLDQARQIRDGILDQFEEVQVPWKEIVSPTEGQRFLRHVAGQEGIGEGEGRPASEPASEDDRAELRLRALMPMLDSPTHPKFGNVRSFRDEISSHTGVAVDEAIKEVCRRFGVPGGGIGTTERTNAYLAQRLDEDGHPDAIGTMRAEVIRLALVAVDNGDVIPGRFAGMWKDLCAHASS